jgi:hypothetical protein
MAMDQCRRRWLQFGIGTLLFMTLCVAGFFAGYRRGFYSGQEAKSRTRVYAKAYYVKDIIDTSPTASTAAPSLMSYIEASIGPRSWNTNGGPGALSYYENNMTIVASNTQDIHDQIADTLKQIRLMQQQGKAKEVESILVSVGT